MRKQGSMRRAGSRGSHHRMVTLMMPGMIRMRARIGQFLVHHREPVTPLDRAMLVVQRALRVSAVGVKFEAASCRCGRRLGLPIHCSY